MKKYQKEYHKAYKFCYQKLLAGDPTLMDKFKAISSSIGEIKDFSSITSLILPQRKEKNLTEDNYYSHNRQKMKKYQREKYQKKRQQIQSIIIVDKSKGLDWYELIKYNVCNFGISITTLDQEIQDKFWIKFNERLLLLYPIDIVQCGLNDEKNITNKYYSAMHKGCYNFGGKNSAKKNNE